MALWALSGMYIERTPGVRSIDIDWWNLHLITQRALIDVGIAVWPTNGLGVRAATQTATRSNMQILRSA